ncbi:MAG: hypothetical protein AAGN35_11080 [Bacteroidota bacterium]
MSIFRLRTAASDGSGALYALEKQSTTVWTGFYLMGQPTNYRNELPFADSLLHSAYHNYPLEGKNGGIYLLAPAPPSDDVRFMNRLAAVLTDLNTFYNGQTYRYVLWISGADATDFDAIPIPFGSDVRGHRTSATASIAFAPYALTLDGGVAVGLNATQNGLLFTSDTEQIRFSVNGKPAGAAIDRVDLSFHPTAEGRGALGFDCALTAGLGSDASWDRLNAGIHFYAPGGTGILRQTYPVLIGPAGETSATIRVRGALDPLRPEDPQRSYLAIPDAFPWSSGFRTVYAEAVDLLPVAGSARLAFTAGADPGGSRTPWHTLSPHGDFSLQLHGETPDYAEASELPVLLGGFSGSEGVQFQPAGPNYPGDRMTFFAGQPAYAPEFLLSGDDATSARTRLDPTCTTAWVTIVAAPGAVVAERYHFTQSSASLTFRPDWQHQVGTPPVRVPAERGFPIAPGGGVMTNSAAWAIPADALVRFEAEIIRPSRRASILWAGERGEELLLPPLGGPLLVPRAM